MSRPRSRPVVRAALERDGNRCVRCHSSRQPEVHHIVALQDGGEDAVGNVATLCRMCHAEWTYLAEPLGVVWGLWVQVAPAWLQLLPLTPSALATYPEDAWAYAIEQGRATLELARFAVAE